MWEISNLSQITGFIFSCVLGVVFCLLYDLFRAFRLVKAHKTIFVFLEDILYFSLASVITFLFLLSITNGEIRGYILFGIALGFFAANFAVSRFFLAVTTKLFCLFKRAFKGFSSSFYWLFEKIDCYSQKIFKNTFKCLKKGLKITKGLLYTNKK